MKFLILIFLLTVASFAQAPTLELNTRTLEALKLAVKYLDNPNPLPAIMYGGAGTMGKMAVRQLENFLAEARQREADIDKIKLLLRDLEAVDTQPRQRVVPIP